MLYIDKMIDGIIDNIILFINSLIIFNLWDENRF